MGIFKWVFSGGKNDCFGDGVPSFVCWWHFNSLCQWSGTAWPLEMCFALFQSWLRFKINLGKLEMVPVGKVHKIEALAGVLGYKISSLPLKYLSPPLGEL